MELYNLNVRSFFTNWRGSGSWDLMRKALFDFRKSFESLKLIYLIENHFKNSNFRQKVSHIHDKVAVKLTFPEQLVTQNQI